MNNQPVDRRLDETRLTGELDDILLNIKYSTIDGLVNLSHYDIRLAKKQILAWHETEKQKAIAKLRQEDNKADIWASNL